MKNNKGLCGVGGLVIVELWIMIFVQYEYRNRRNEYYVL